MKPIIGITSDFSGEASSLCAAIREPYISEVMRAGGIPVLIPFCSTPDDAEEYAARCDGILFPGGAADVSPHLYNEEPLHEVRFTSSAMDATQLALVKAAQHLRKPVFGICRGCQLINVALGGTLFQDIPRQVPESIGHYQKEILVDELYHSVSILPGESRMASIFKAPAIRVNSLHHQAVKQLAPGLRVTAKSPDGIIEAFEGTDTAWYVHAVQFHAEELCGKYPEFRRLFADFTAACIRS